MVTGNTHASYRFASAVISVGIVRDFQQTFIQGQDFGVVLSSSYTGSFGYALTPFIDTALSASYSENEPTGVGNSTGNQSSNTFSAGASLAWRLRPWLTMGLDYTYTRYTSGATSSGTVTGNGAATATGPATENRAAIRLTSSF